MKKIFIDTNILIDVFTQREDFYINSAKVLSAINKGKFKGFVSALTYPNIYYILRKVLGKEKAIETLEKTKTICDTVPLDIKCIELAIVSAFSNFEDAIQYYSAVSSNCVCIVTRNPKHFKKGEISAFNPDEFLSIYT